MKHKNIIVDGQVMQTSAWSRGMGRYVASLIMGIYENKNPPKVTIVLNKNLDTSENCMDVLKKVAPRAEIAWLDFPRGLSDEVEMECVQVLDRYVQDSGLEGALFINGSLFSFDYQPAFPSKTVNSSIFYDMIPLKFWNIFHKYFPAHEYFKRFKYLFENDCIFAISNASKADLMQYLGLSQDKIINIAGAKIPHFMDEDSGMIVPPDLKYRYVLLPGGNSPHKNMLRAVRAFDIFNAEFGDSFRLVITSSYSSDNIKKMHDISDNIILTGNVSDSELHGYYKNAEAVLFPSLDEGLGLPVLEAIGYEKPVVCSDIDVFREVSSKAFYAFNPLKVSEMSSAIRSAVMRENWSARKKQYQSIQLDFTWSNTAKKIINSMISKELNTANHRSGSVMIQQDGTLDSLRAVASVISSFGGIEGIKLFIDERFERIGGEDKIPIIFKAFMKTNDVADALRRSRGDVVAILSPASDIIVPVGIAVKAKFVGSEGYRELAISNLEKNYGVSINDMTRKTMLSAMGDK